MRKARRAAVAALLALASAPLAAHDFWIEPSTFRPAPEAVVAIGLRVGQNFAGDPVPRSSALIDTFVARQGAREEPVAGSEGADPAGLVIARRGETTMVAYRSTPSFIEMPADRFEDYLRLEGLDDIVALRHSRGISGQAGRETFTRYAKALLTGTTGSPAVTQPVGFEMEIVPDADPTVRCGAFSGTVLYAGAPLAQALVVAIPRDNPAARSSVRTDATGAFRFSALRPGVWLIKSVHMVEAGWWSRWVSGVDWQSSWASLTFEVPEM
jgi:hypothetical protein